jgi:hypothetical protein
VLTYDPDVVQSVKDKMKEVETNEVKMDGVAWVSWKWIEADLRQIAWKLGWKKVWKHTFMWSWTNPRKNGKQDSRGCRYLNGEELNARKFGFFQRGGSTNLWILKRHYLLIKAELKRRILRESSRVYLLDDFYQNLEKQDGRLGIVKAASRFGFSPAFLYGCLIGLPSELAELFDGGKLPHEPRKLPGKKKVKIVLITDMQALKNGLIKAIRHVKKSKDLKCAPPRFTEITRLFVSLSESSSCNCYAI